MDTEEQPTKNIRSAAVSSQQIRPQSVATTPRQTRAMTRQELPCTSAANNRLASTNRKRTHQDPDEHDAFQLGQIQGNANNTGRSENLHQCSQGQPDGANLLQHASQQKRSRMFTKANTLHDSEVWDSRYQCRRLPYQEYLQETPIFRKDTTWTPLSNPG